MFRYHLNKLNKFSNNIKYLTIDDGIFKTGVLLNWNPHQT